MKNCNSFVIVPIGDKICLKKNANVDCKVEFMLPLFDRIQKDKQEEDTVKSSLIYSMAIILCFLFIPQSLYAKPSASMKFTTIREENPKIGKETLILPYAFPSDSLGTTLGVGGLAKGYGQDQLLVAGSVWGSFDDAVGVVLGLWDYKLPATNRFFFSIMGSAGDYPR